MNATDKVKPMSDSQELTASPNDGVGAKLKAIRLEKKLNIEDFTKLSAITVSKVQALEEEQYRKVGTETFVIGYIRKYATWLGVDADALVNEYKSQIGESALPNVLVTTEQPLPDTAPKPKSEKVLKPVPAHVDVPQGQLINKLKAIPAWWILALLVGLWLIGTLVFVPSADREQEEQELPAQVETNRETPAPEVIEEPAQVETEQQVDIVEQSTEDTSVIETAEVQTKQVQAPEAVERVNSAPANAVVQPAALDELVLTFTDDCWVEIKNASGKIIFAAVQTPADTLTLADQAPFEIMLGNARAVAVKMNDREIEVKPRPGRKTLRFTVAN